MRDVRYHACKSSRRVKVMDNPQSCRPINTLSSVSGDLFFQKLFQRADFGAIVTSCLSAADPRDKGG